MNTCKGRQSSFVEERVKDVSMGGVMPTCAQLSIFSSFLSSTSQICNGGGKKQ